MELKSFNPTLTQDQTAKNLGYPTSSLQRCGNDIKMQRLQKTSRDLKWPPKISKESVNHSIDHWAVKKWIEQWVHAWGW